MRSKFAVSVIAGFISLSPIYGCTIDSEESQVQTSRQRSVTTERLLPSLAQGSDTPFFGLPMSLRHADDETQIRLSTYVRLDNPESQPKDVKSFTTTLSRPDGSTFWNAIEPANAAEENMTRNCLNEGALPKKPEEDSALVELPGNSSCWFSVPRRQHLERFLNGEDLFDHSIEVDVAVEMGGSQQVLSSGQYPVRRYVTPNAERGLTFPFGTNGLPPNAFYYRKDLKNNLDSGHDDNGTSQQFAIDFAVWRWDPGLEEWSSRKEGASGALCVDMSAWQEHLADPSANPYDGENGCDEYLIWNQEVYAMLDGVVETIVEDQMDGVPESAELPDGTTQPGARKNQVVIRSGDLLTRYHHFKYQTVEVAVGDTVLAGQYLGRAGASGLSKNNGFPVMHVSLEYLPSSAPEWNMVSLPLQFRNVFSLDAEPLSDSGLDPDYDTNRRDAAWAAVQNQGADKGSHFYPSAMIERDHQTASEARRVEVGQVPNSAGENRWVTLQKGVGDKLEVRSWTMDERGRVNDLAEAISEPVLDFDLVPLSGERVLTALRADNDELVMRVWRATSSSISELDDYRGGDVQEVALTSPSASLARSYDAVSVVRDPESRVRLETWSTGSQGQHISKRDGLSSSRQGSHMDIAHGMAFFGAVTVHRNDNGEQEVSSFSINTDGTDIDFEDSETQGQIADAKITYLRTIPADNSQELDVFVTSAIHDDGSLKVRVWTVAENGEVSHIGSKSGTGVKDVSIARVDAQHVVISTQGDDDRHRLFAWRVRDDLTLERGSTERSKSIQGTALAAIGAVQHGADPRDQRVTTMIATANRNEEGDLDTRIWEVNLTASSVGYSGESSRTLFDFEAPSEWLWSSFPGTVSVVSSVTPDGGLALSLEAPLWGNYMRVTSPLLNVPDSAETSSKILMDVYVPEAQPNPWWIGTVQLFVTDASQNYNNQPVANAVMLTTGWQVVAFDISPDLAAVLESASDITLAITPVLAPLAPAILVDNIRFD